MENSNIETTVCLNSNEKIEQITDAIINSRDFCGDEMRAAKEEAFELGFRGENLVHAVKLAKFRANARWNKFQRAAGVKEKHLF